MGNFNKERKDMPCLEFQVFYLPPTPTASGTVPDIAPPVAPASVKVLAENEKEAVRIAGCLGVTVLSIGYARVVLQPDQVWFDRREAGEYLRGTPCKIDELMARGLLPKARDGRPLFHRKTLDKLVESRMATNAGAASATGSAIPILSSTEARKEREVNEAIAVRTDYEFAVIKAIYE